MVKSKRAREAADSVAETQPAADLNGSSVPQDKSEQKLKKRKRDTEDVNGAENGSASAEKKSKKDKKDKKDKKKHDKESRKEKKDKRKNLQDLPEEVMEDAEEDAAGQTPSKTEEDNAEARTKEEKRARKLAKREEKKQRKETEQGTTAATSKSTDKASASTAAPSTTAESKDDPIDLGEPSEDAAADKKDRHIVFVGNLPFSATAASITAHFASLSPVAVRCLRNRDDPNPCRGIAFVEFGKVWHQRTCLDKFHHSTFDDGVSPARKINVELT